MSSFVVTTSIRGSSRTQVWESSQPLALGHPFKWILERSENGVRLRSLARELGKIENGGVHEIPTSKLLEGAEIETPSFKFRIKPVRKIAPAFELGATGDVLRVYRCSGAWVIDSQTFEGGHYVAQVAKRKIFSLKKSGSKGSSAQYLVQSAVEGLRIAGGSERVLKSGETIELSAETLAESTATFVPAGASSAQTWRFGLSSSPAFVDSKRRIAGALESQDADAFKKALIYASACLTLFGLISAFWPKAEVEKELVPAQFAKIVLAKPEKNSAAAPSESGAPAVSKEIPKKVRDAAVVQAFRAKALSNAVQGLLKGGMTKLLAQSDFVSGSKKSLEARSILDSKSTALRATAPSAALGERNVQVAALGGEAKGVDGKAIGYGKGERAAVAGQGKGFVPFVSADSSGSVVDEGLTKDEVGEVIHRHLSEVRYCYESAMVRAPDVEGKLITAFVIGGNGIVKSAEAKSSTLPDPRLDDCILRRLATWKFPKPRGGVDVAVSYPFIFKTLGR